jgi:hypothetical protein
LEGDETRFGLADTRPPTQIRLPRIFRKLPMPVDVPSETASGRENGDPPNGSPAPEHTAADAFRVILDRVAELRTFGAYYVSAKLDRLKLTIRQIVLLAILGLVAVIAAAAVAVTAIVLVLRGMAGGLAVLCGNTPWLGDLLCGVLVLGILIIGLWSFVRSFTKVNRQATVEKYEREQIRQRADLGSDVTQRAQDAKSS